MRSSYAVADELDFMPMNEFQRQMFLIRQDEWDVYRTELPVTQGDLSDPAYFDFMSYCQYATIADGMRNGKMLFNELIDANGTTVVVSRADNPKSPRDNAALPDAHAQIVGERILTWIDDRFPTIAPKVPVSGGGRPSAAALMDGVRQIAAVFEINEYMLQDSIELNSGGNGFTWTLVAPANLWSSLFLRARGDYPSNDFEAKAVLAYLRRCGVPASVTSKYTDTRVTHEFRWIGVERAEIPRSNLIVNS